MKPGIYDGLPNHDYHSGEGISNSGLSLVRRSPLHYLARRVAANDNSPTPAQFIGTAFHALMLEPELFANQYTLGLRMRDVPDAIDSRDTLVAMVEELNKGRKAKLSTTGTKEELATRFWEALTPEGQTDTVRDALATCSGKVLKEYIEDLNKDRHGLLSTSGKTMDQLAQTLRENGKPITLWADAKAEWMRNNGHRDVLEPEQWDQLMNMREATLAHPAARALLTSPGKAEQSVYWIDAQTGELCRCRPDRWNDNGVIVDLKTTEDASQDGFAKSIANFAYDVQDAFYQDGIQAATGKAPRAFVFVAVEKTARIVNGEPLGVGVYQLDEASRQLGRAKYREDLGVYAQCKKNDVWPCYGERIQTISVPQWQFTKNAHLLTAVV